MYIKFLIGPSNMIHYDKHIIRYDYIYNNYVCVIHLIVYKPWQNI